ncbi:MAG TPA: M14 family zinc carboxypeptidase [Bacteroidales bacterium]|nr:M14 family zinc carboxypeptidase [Bacteroidales bacterium]HOK97764.1 M14 family zinc carboxypeptidase [Bacteroidales bacterium]HPO64740.1 M14 family zinc carboxypeptidase [Bacteroidales bacterium]
MKKLLLLLGIICFKLSPIFAGEVDTILQQRGELHIKFAVPSAYSMEQLSQIMSIARFRDDTVEAFLNRSQWENFKKLQIPYSIVYQQKRTKSWGGYLQSYPSEKAYEQVMQRFQNDYPALCYLYEVGRSVKNRPLLFARINSDTSVAKPSIMLTSSMHGNETGGMILMLRLIDYLLTHRQDNAQVKYLTDSLDIWINPLSNPDGMYFDSTDIYQATRFNANGVDLNRNFPDPVKGSHPDGMAYQPETWAMMQLLKRYHFVMSANFHSGEEVVNYPWDSKPTFHPDNDWFRMLAQTYADSAIRYGTNGYFMTYIGNSNIAGITNGYAWYPVFGGRQDYVTYFMRGREVTIEIDKDFITPETKLDQLWQANYRSLLAWMSFALQGVRGIVTDSLTGKPIAAYIAVTGHDEASAMITSDSARGVFFRLLLPGNYSFSITCPGYRTRTFESIKVCSGTYTYLNVSLIPEGNTSISRVEIFPNPVRDRLYIRLDDDKWDYAVINGQGKVLIQGVSPCEHLNVSHLSPGVYILRIKGGNTESRYRFMKLP